MLDIHNELSWLTYHLGSTKRFWSGAKINRHPQLLKPFFKNTDDDSTNYEEKGRRNLKNFAYLYMVHVLKLFL